MRSVVFTSTPAALAAAAKFAFAALAMVSAFARATSTAFTRTTSSLTLVLDLVERRQGRRFDFGDGDPREALAGLELVADLALTSSSNALADTSGAKPRPASGSSRENRPESPTARLCSRATLSRSAGVLIRPASSSAFLAASACAFSVLI